MRLRSNNPLIYFLVFLAVISFGARVVPAVEMKASANKIHLNNEASLTSETISCIVGSTLLKDQNVENIEFRFFAKNDITHHEFELTDELYNAIKPKFQKSIKGEWLVFHANFKDLFYKKNINAPYKWTWQARPEPPLSPVSDYRDQQVKKLQCWFTVTVNNKTYKSKKVSLQVQ